MISASLIARRAVAEETLNRDLAELRVWYAAGAIKEVLELAGTAGSADRQSLGLQRSPIVELSK